jgi:hypothetical protein
VAEHREKSQLLGDFLRDVAILVVVFYPLDAGLQGRFDWDIGILIFAMAGFLLWLGMILEGKDDL